MEAFKCIGLVVIQLTGARGRLSGLLTRVRWKPVHNSQVDVKAVSVPDDTSQLV